jgi:hypothetical protein
MSEEVKFESWAIVDLMGHVRYAGRVTEEERFGAKIGRVDVPTADGGWTTVFFGGASVYRLIPTTEEVARVAAIRTQPEPVHAWELPRQAIDPPTSLRHPDGEEDPRYEDHDF